MARIRRVDVAVAVVVALLDLVGFFIVLTVPAPFDLSLTPLMYGLTTALIVIKSALLLVRRTRPLLVFTAISAAETVVPIVSLSVGENSVTYNGIAAIVAAVSLALHTAHRSRDFAMTTGLAFFVGVLRAVTVPSDITSEQELLKYLAIPGWAVPIMVAFVLGLMIRNSRELNESLRERAELAEVNAIIEERNRIAAELHDTTAHHLSAIAIQTNAVKALIDENPEAARMHLKAISESANKALDDVRATVGRLSATEAEIQRVPQPSTSQVRQLVDESLALGMDLTVRGELPEGLSSTQQTSLYRIVQEALTNARKHAPGQPVIVDFSHQSVSVTTRGDFTRGHAGRGTRSIAERAKALGASVRNEPIEAGWVVQVDWSGA